MNLEQRTKILQSIRQTQGLLAYATSIGEETEQKRLQALLDELVDGLSD